jgi:hypothetical protein
MPESGAAVKAYAIKVNFDIDIAAQQPNVA